MAWAHKNMWAEEMGRYKSLKNKKQTRSRSVTNCIHNKHKVQKKNDSMIFDADYYGTLFNRKITSEDVGEEKEFFPIK